MKGLVAIRYVEHNLGNPMKKSKRIGSLAAELAQKIEYLMQPENSWRVMLDEKGNVIWVSGDTILRRQPAQSFWQWVQDVFFN